MCGSSVASKKRHKIPCFSPGTEAANKASEAGDEPEPGRKKKKKAICQGVCPSPCPYPGSRANGSLLKVGNSAGRRRPKWPRHAGQRILSPTGDMPTKEPPEIAPHPGIRALGQARPLPHPPEASRSLSVGRTGRNIGRAIRKDSFNGLGEKHGLDSTFSDKENRKVFLGVVNVNRDSFQIRRHRRNQRQLQLCWDISASRTTGWTGQNRFERVVVFSNNILLKDKWRPCALIEHGPNRVQTARPNQSAASTADTYTRPADQLFQRDMRRKIKPQER